MPPRSPATTFKRLHAAGVGWIGLMGLMGLTALSAPAAFAAVPFSDREDGVSCSYYDVFLRLSWPQGRPVGLDMDGRANGPRPWASERSEAGDTRRVRRVDVSKLVQAWWSGQLPNAGLLLRVSAGVGAMHTREAADPTLRPQLVLTLADGKQRFVEPAADTTLDCSTYRGLGAQNTITLRPNTAAMLRFELQAIQASERQPPRSAQLVLVRTPDAGPGALQLDVLAVQAPQTQNIDVRSDGLAQRYPRDQGIERDPDVLFTEGFEGRDIDPRWTPGMRAPSRIVQDDPAAGFEPLTGRALRITIPKGQQVGLDLRYRFKDRHGTEPDDIHFRYALRLARSWLGTGDGGKLPGLAGTYGQAGWGGRPWDGNKGWSMRGSHSLSPPPGHPAAGQLMLGSYAYHAGSGAAFGEIWPWWNAWAGLIAPDRWYSIEQRLRLNTPGRDDGLLEVWVDGRLALTRSGLRLRDRADIRIEEVWMNFFHGGTAPAPQDMQAYIDHVVVARRYIGPVQR